MEVFKSSGEPGIVVIHVDDNENVEVKFNKRINISVIFSKDVSIFDRTLQHEQQNRCGQPPVTNITKLDNKGNVKFVEGAIQSEADECEDAEIHAESCISLLSHNENEDKSLSVCAKKLQHKKDETTWHSIVPKDKLSVEEKGNMQIHLYQCENGITFNTNSENKSVEYDEHGQVDDVSMDVEKEQTHYGSNITSEGFTRSDFIKKEIIENADVCPSKTKVDSYDKEMFDNEKNVNESGSTVTISQNLDESNHEVRQEKLRDFLCNICQKVFSSYQRLDAHQRAATKKIKCCICKQICMSRAHFLLHYHSLHISSGKTFRKSCEECPLCYQQFLDNTDLIEHIRCWHTNEGMYQCCVCSRVFRSYATFTLHLDNFRMTKMCSKGKSSNSVLNKTSPQKSKGKCSNGVSVSQSSEGAHSDTPQKSEGKSSNDVSQSSEGAHSDSPQKSEGKGSNDVSQSSEGAHSDSSQKSEGKGSNDVSQSSEGAHSDSSQKNKPEPEMATSQIAKNKALWMMQRKPKSEITSSKSVDVDSIKTGVVMQIIKIKDKNNLSGLRKVWECLFCERKFKGGHEFNNHKKPMRTVLVCKKCGARAKSKAEYLLHQHERHSEEDVEGDRSFHHKSHKCPVCREDDFHSDILTHIMLEHTGELPYTCCICGISLDSNESWVSHGKSHLDSSDDKSNSTSILIQNFSVVKNAEANSEKICKLCKGNFKSERDFVHHHKNEIKQRECNICKILHFTEAGFIVHRYISHGLCPGEESSTAETLLSSDVRRRLWEEDVLFEDESESIKCPCCPKSSLINEILFHVMKSHTLEAPFQCCACKKLFPSPDEYFDHCDFHLGKKTYDSKTPLCLQCNLRFESRGALKAHQDMHDTICPYCQMEFSSNIFLDIHLQNVHTSEMEACSFCGKLFSSSDKLATHERHHFYLKEIQCSLCGKAVFNKVGLRRHMKAAHSDNTNTEVDFYLCSICGKKFSQKRNLESHKLSHQPDEQFECEVCGKKFRSNTHLKSHAKIHLQERRLFVCHVCGKSCTASYNLKVHMRIHSNVKVFKCSFCDQGFNYNQSLQSHIKKKHKLQVGQLTTQINNSNGAGTENNDMK